MEDTDEFKWAVKVVIKRQMRDLMTQLQENGEEIAIMSVNLDDESCSFFGSTKGEWFLSEQKNLSASFLNFCKSKAKKNGSDASPGTDFSKQDFAQTAAVGQRSNRGSVQKSDGTIRVKKFTQGRKPNYLVKEPDPAIINVIIPTSMAPTTTEEELAALVGRLFAAQVVAGKVLDDQGTKFDDLYDAVNMRDAKADGKRPGSTLISPSSKKVKLNTGGSALKSTTRSGRKVSSRFLEGLNSLKKVRAAVVAAAAQTEEKSDKEVAVEEEKSEEKVADEFNLMKEICDLDPAAFRRFHVSTREGDYVNVLRVSFANEAEVKEVAVKLIQAIHKAVHSVELLDLKKVELIVSKEEMAKPKIKIVFGQITETDSAQILENMDTEDDTDGDSSMDELQDDDSDLDCDTDDMKVIETSSTPRQAKSVSTSKHGKSPLMKGLKWRPKRRVANELMLMKCEECGISVTGRSNLKSHYRRIHLHVRNYTCSICNKGFWSNNARESHMLAVHTRKCESCEEYVVESVPWGKGVDMKTKRDVICSCGSIVSIYSTFGRRRMYLRDDEPDEDGNIRPRPKSNAGTKYACGTCGKLFMKKSNCERHSRAHGDVKHCVCNICGNSYTYEASLKKHMQTEHGIVKHVCELCGGNYSNLTALKVHMVKAHHNVAIGENVAIVVQTKGEVDEDLEEFEEALQAKELENQQQQAAAVKEQAFVVSREGNNRGRVFIQTPSGEQVLVNTSEAGILPEQGEETMVKTAQIQVEEEDLVGGESSQQVVISTESGEGVSQEATAQIVQEALRSGQIVAQEGGMSIIIKQVQVESSDLA